MEEDLSTDASAALKRRITEMVSGVKGDGADHNRDNNQQIYPPELSKSLSPEEESPVVRSTVEEEEGSIVEEIIPNTLVLVEDPVNSFQKKAKWYPCKPILVSDSQENQEMRETEIYKQRLSSELEDVVDGQLSYASFADNKEQDNLVEQMLVKKYFADESEDENFVKASNDYEILADVIKRVSPQFSGNCETVEVELGKNRNDEVGLIKMMKNDGEKVSFQKTCSFKIEVIDDTAVIDASKIVESSGRVDRKIELDAKKEKRSRRRTKTSRKVSEGNGKLSNPNGCKIEGHGFKILYTREQMEAMRFLNVKGQKKMWQQIYNGLPSCFRRQYDELADFRHHKHGRLSLDPHQTVRRNSNFPGILGELCSQNVNCDAETMSSTDYVCDDDHSSKDDSYAMGECREDESSDNDYDGILRPAFLVEGEPNFDSGPPEDGLEYLRRVRWEAAQIPKVTVAKLDVSKLNKEQSIYMPQIPDIDKCPEHLVPSKEWEDDFVADFSELRLALSQLESPGDIEFVKLQPMFSGQEESSERTPVVEIGDLSDVPTVSAVLSMDPVTQVAALKRRIGQFESSSTFSKTDCMWLFALFVAVDTPLDADTCAAIRCLLRKCAKLLAAKSVLDDEAVMLNILATISGKCFGQSGK
ncbi:hypothetical protein Nepgr_010549 [Nepenthes gracilis]|uniref:Gem-associated protein 2 n=1 Tax=Nepenthes gracilis TaxID=150966 RepID=A0AAD3SD61_NEPGR|nr:hypothetical protein Nepgr_010549 [Nepenthes gracilis]